jgi:hypothetical protein
MNYPYSKAEKYIVRVIEPPKLYKYKYRLMVEIVSGFYGNYKVDLCGKGLLDIYTNNFDHIYDYGNLLEIDNLFKELPNVKIPGVFDTKKFYKTKDIYNYCFLKVKE